MREINSPRNLENPGIKIPKAFGFSRHGHDLYHAEIRISEPNQRNEKVRTKIWKSGNPIEETNVFTLRGFSVIGKNTEK